LLTVLCNQVYEPLGVNPASVGLGYGELLIRAAVAWVGIVGLLLGGVAMGALTTWLVASKSKPRAVSLLIIATLLLILAGILLIDQRWAVAGLTTGAGVLIGGWVVVIPTRRAKGSGLAVVGEARRRSATEPTLIFLVLALVLLITGTFLVVAAAEDRSRLQQGLRPVPIAGDTPPPWNAEVVRASWVNSPGPTHPRMPRCLLYLGQANGTSVLYDARPAHHRTLRSPNSSVAIEVLPDRDSVLPPEQGRGPCSNR